MKTDVSFDPKTPNYGKNRLGLDLDLDRDYSPKCLDNLVLTKMRILNVHHSIATKRADYTG